LKKIKISDQTTELLRKSLINFVIRYGDEHITKKAINWLKSVPFPKINQENGDLIHIYVEGKKIVGLLAIANYGMEQAFIVVHPNFRKTGVAYQLVVESLEDIDRFYVKVANDNVPSLKLCFATGMYAFDLIKGPTGKPTLVLGIGNWEEEEWNSSQKK